MRAILFTGEEIVNHFFRPGMMGNDAELPIEVFGGELTTKRLKHLLTLLDRFHSEWYSFFFELGFVDGANLRRLVYVFE